MDDLVERAKARLARGSKSFAAAASLLPFDKRQSVILLYSWCRHCDDVIDNEELGFERKTEAAPVGDRLEQLRCGTMEALQGRAREPDFQCLQRVVHEHRMPDRYPLELLHGMAMDATGHRYETIEDTLSYCYHVAGVVGVMSAIILGVRDRSTLERASDLGIAFQLTNIARDVIADAQRGRVYLPTAWLDEADIKVSTLSDADSRAALYEVVERLLDVSEGYYRSASAGIARLPLRSAWAVAAARRIYSGIGRKLKTRGPTSLDSRLATHRASKVASGLFAAVDALALSWLGQAESREGLWTPDSLFA